MRNNPETFLQIQFVNWLETKGILHNSSMAGVNLGIRTAVMRKRMGARAGFPDVQILEPAGKYFGLFIELKAGNNKATTEQKEWQKELNKRGYLSLIMPSGLDYTDGFNWLKHSVMEYLEQGIRVAGVY